MGVVGEVSDLIGIGTVCSDQPGGPDTLLVGPVLDQTDPLTPLAIVAELDESVRSDLTVIVAVLLVPDDPEVLDGETRLNRSGRDGCAVSEGLRVLDRLESFETGEAESGGQGDDGRDSQ